MSTPIARPRLHRRLDAALSGSMVAVCAMAGAGKTTAVRQWLAESPREHVWVGLDARDDDPVRFWQRLGGALTEGVWGAETTPGRDELDEMLALVPRERRVAVVDDLHAVTTPSVHEGLAYLAERLPHPLVLVSRGKLPSAFARLRAAGRVQDLDGEELAFTLDEVAQLLPEDTVFAELVFRRTWGWPVAVELSRALAARSPGDHDRALPMHDLADYLAHEVLGTLPVDMREFVRDLAVLDEPTAATANAVLGIDDAAERIHSLVQQRLFLSPAAGGWALHGVVRDVLRDDLDSTTPGRAREIHRRASRFFADSDAERAIGHALAADDLDVAAELVELHRAELHSVRYATQLRWLLSIGESAIRARPALRAHAVVVASYERRPDLVARWSRDHDEVTADSAEALGTTVMTLVHSGDMPRLAHAAARLRARIDESSSLWRFCHGALTGSLMATGDLEGALGVITGMLLPVDAAPVQFLSLQSSARAVTTVLLAELGRLGQARAALGELEAWVEEASSVEGFSDLGAVRWASAMLGLAEGDPKAARAWCEPPSPESAFGLPFLEAWLQLDFALARLAVGDEPAARGALHRAQVVLGRFADPAELGERLRVVGAPLGVLPLVRRVRPVSTPSEELSERELTVLRTLDSDLSAREIAERLFLSPNTLKTHLRAVYRKLGVSSRLSAVRTAREHGLIHPGG